MVRNKIFLCSILWLAVGTATAQPGEFVEKGLTRASATIAQGLFLRNHVQPLYLHLNVDYYIEHKIKSRIRGVNKRMERVLRIKRGFFSFMNG